MKHVCKYCKKEFELDPWEESLVQAHKNNTESDLEGDSDTDISPYSCEIVSTPAHSLIGEYSGSINNLFAEYHDEMCVKCSKELGRFLKLKIVEWKKGKL